MNPLYDNLVVPDNLEKIKISTYSAATRQLPVKDMLVISNQVGRHMHWMGSTIKVNWQDIRYALYYIDSNAPAYAKHTIKKVATKKTFKFDTYFGKKGDTVETDLSDQLIALGVNENDVFQTVFEYEFDKEIEWVLGFPNPEEGIL